MKVRTICWARNECDIIEAFVRHHARFSDVLIVLHRCIDNSEEILRALSAEGLPVKWRTDERLIHEQSVVMSELMRESFRDGADWVLPLDADEFLHGDVISVLQTQGSDSRVIRAPWKGYVPTSKDDATEPNVLKRITHRRSHEYPSWYKMMIPKTTDTSAGLCFGNHALIDSAGNRLAHTDTQLVVAHFPVRSDRQVMRKTFGGWLSYTADPTHAYGGSFQWKALYEKMKSGHSPSRDELTQLAMDYATEKQWQSLPASFAQGPLPSYDPQENLLGEAIIVSDPIPCDFIIKYAIKDAEPMRVLLETAEDIALSYAENLRKKS